MSARQSPSSSSVMGCTVIFTGPDSTSAGSVTCSWCCSSTWPISSMVFMAAPSLPEQGARLAVGLVAVAVFLLAFDCLPVYQLNRRRHDAGEAGPFDRLEALTAAGSRLVLAAAEFLRAAAGR